MNSKGGYPSPQNENTAWVSAIAVVIRMKSIKSNSSSLMKLHSLISLLILGMALVVHAQEQAKPAPFPYTPPPRKPETVSKNPNAVSTGGKEQRTSPLPDATRAEVLLPPGGPAAPGATAPSSVPVPAEVTTVIQPADADPFAADKQASTKFNINLSVSISMVLSGKTLADAVAEIEQHIQDPKRVKEGGRPIMPTLVFAADCRDAPLSGSLRLAGVSPVQAVALACAAAGCVMDPIYAPSEGSDTGSADPFAGTGKIIGYQITHGTAPSRSASSFPAARPRPAVDLILGGVGLVLKKSDAGIVVEEVLPGSPAAAQSTIERGQCVVSVAEPGKPTVDTTKMELEPVVALLRGSPGMPVTVTLASGKGAEMKNHTVTLVRASLPLTATAGRLGNQQEIEQKSRFHYGQMEDYERNQVGLPVQVGRSAPQPKVTVISADAMMSGSGDAFGRSTGSSPASSTAPPADNKQPIVRVYALGAAIVGRPGESVEEMKRKAQLVGEIEELIRQTLDTAGLDHTSLNLSVHRGLGVLVAKASMAQHEMIEQVVKALRESEAEAAPTPIINPEPLRLPTGMPAK